MKVLIVEDEFNSRRLLRKLLEDEFVNLEFLEASSVEEGIVLINEETPKIILCDIQLRNERSFEIFSNIDIYNFELIFTTAHNEFALKAFEFGATQYILKPINREKLYSVMHKCINRINLIDNKDRTRLVDQAESIGLNKLLIPGNQSSKVIRVEDIIFCKADGVYCTIYLEEGKKELVVKPMGFLEEKLILHPHFFRPHKSFLININKVIAISGDKSFLTLSNKQIIPVGRTKKDELQEILRITFF